MTEVLRTSKMLSGSRWDGHTIDRTKNCEGCEFLIKFVDDLKESATVEDGCGWGVAWKRFVETINQRKCTKIGRENAKLNYLRKLGAKF